MNTNPNTRILPVGDETQQLNSFRRAVLRIDKELVALDKELKGVKEKVADQRQKGYPEQAQILEEKQTNLQQKYDGYMGALRIIKEELEREPTAGV